MKVPMVDLGAQNREIEAQISALLARLHEKTAYVGGPLVVNFENAFANYLGVRRVVGVGSGTDALRLALMALGVGPGCEVITTPLTFIATVAAIGQTGARPVFADVDPLTGIIDCDAVADYLASGRFMTPRGPAAVVAVDLYGLPAPVERLAEIARSYGLWFVEDACQSHGAVFRDHCGNWRKAGSWADAAAFSFYPGKNLGAWGDGGAVATNDEELAERIARLRDHGRVNHYEHAALGFNSRLDALQAAVLMAKLPLLDNWNRSRRRIADSYRSLLADDPVVLPFEPGDRRSAYHLFVTRLGNRDGVRAELERAGIATGVHYPLPLHMQPACMDLGYCEGSFPESERWARNILSLPMHPHLTDSQVELVGLELRRALQRTAR